MDLSTTAVMNVLSVPTAAGHTVVAVIHHTLPLFIKLKAKAIIMVRGGM
jgi:hypothetical protein